MKNFIITLILLICVFSMQAQVREHEIISGVKIDRNGKEIVEDVYLKLKLLRNKDKSYGDKEKVFCTSLAYLNFAVNNKPHSRELEFEISRTLDGMIAQEGKVDPKDMGVYALVYSLKYKGFAGGLVKEKAKAGQNCFKRKTGN